MKLMQSGLGSVSASSKILNKDTAGAEAISLECSDILACSVLIFFCTCVYIPRARVYM